MKVSRAAKFSTCSRCGRQVAPGAKILPDFQSGEARDDIARFMHIGCVNKELATT